LLEDFYGNDFGVTQMETVLRACRAAGLYTAVHLTYPCPYDDRHTRAETLRVIRRCRPDAAVIRLPRLIPGAAWFSRAPEFGFAVAGQRYQRWAQAMIRESGPARLLDDHRRGTFPCEFPYHMNGWPRDRALQAHIELIEEIRSLNIALSGSARLGLMARLAGCAGEEAAFIERFTRALFTFDVETAASFATCINANAVQPRNRYVLRPFHSVLAAVAN
jgi:hypothetical protein